MNPRDAFRHAWAPRLSSRLAALLVFALAGAAAGCGYVWHPDKSESSQAQTETQSFDFLYERNCAGCHGADGNLGPAPPLNDRLFTTIIPDDELLKVIRDGRQGTPMPAFAKASGGSLADTEVRALAVGIKRRWPPLPEKERPRGLPAYTAVGETSHVAARQPLRPRAGAQSADLFARACGDCHGEDGQGGSAGPIAVSAFLDLMSDQGLRRIMITGRSDLGMPDFANGDGRSPEFHPLSSSDINELVAYLRQLGKSTAPGLHSQSVSRHQREPETRTKFVETRRRRS